MPLKRNNRIHTCRRSWAIAAPATTRRRTRWPPSTWSANRREGVELDTTLTRDGACRDPRFDCRWHNRWQRAGAQPGPEDDPHPDAGSHDASFKGEQVPTLDETFEALGPDLIVNVELKTNNWRSEGLETAVLAILRRHNAAGRVVVSSFNPFALRRFRALAPDIPIGYLYAPDEPVYLRYGWFMLGLPHEARHPHHSIIDEHYMAWAKARGYRVHTWTVDDPARIRVLRDLGVAAIISNRPDVALEALGRKVGAR
jgi:glycerophosphoryl diester phosphodiesterase